MKSVTWATSYYYLQSSSPGFESRGENKTLFADTRKIQQNWYLIVERRNLNSAVQNAEQAPNVEFRAICARDHSLVPGRK